MYYSGWSTGKKGKKEGNEDRIEDLSDEDEEEEVGQGDSSAEEEEKSETEVERDARGDEEEREMWSAVVRTLAGIALLDDWWKRMDEVSRGDDTCARIEKEVRKVSKSASNQEKWTLRKAVAFSKQPATTHSVKNTTPKTPKAQKMPRKKAPALHTGN